MNQGWPRNWGLQKPPCGVPIDRGHPLAQGLIAAGLARSGERANLATGVPTKIVGGVPVVVTTAGEMWDFSTAANDYIEFSDVACFAPPFSVVLEIMPINEVDVQICGFGGISSAGGWAIQKTSAGTDRLRFNIGNGVGSYDWSGYFATFGIRYAVGVTVNQNGGVATAYKNGVALSSQACGTIPLPAASPFMLGASFRSGAPLIGWAGKINYCYLYNRVLSANEMQQLYSQPYCMFESAEPFAGDVPAAAVYETQKRRLLGAA